RLLEPVRQYAAHHLAARQETAATRARHAAFYLALAEEAVPALRGPAQGTWLARLARERDNLRAALRWAEERGEAESGLRLVVALAPFWEVRGHLGEGRRWLTAALAAPGANDAAPALRARALAVAGWLAQHRAEFAVAAAYHKRSLALYRALGDRRGIAAALGELGFEARLEGKLTRSARLLAASLALCRAADDRPGLAFALLQRGETAWAQGDTACARASIEEALAYYQERGDRRMVAIARAELGLVAWRERALDLAATHFAAALAEHDALDDRWFLVYDLRGLAAVLADRGRWPRAARLLAAAAGIKETLGDPGIRVGDVTWGPFAERVRAALGDDAFAAAWAAGAALPRAAVLAYARGSAAAPVAGPARPGPRAGRAPDALTRREREVALLLARGHSDRQVAEALSIGVGTAGGHAHHILEKLGLRSRHQVAAWAVAQGLLAPPPD
ncbi:MAG TPA: LuxR C-terminal-related transcriptional regulator, partial [Thermomicrobiales bacterium]|nr:LuxR C-terminal-related transcriptional regulator [Thermomicrobiales bacterium]